MQAPSPFLGKQNRKATGGIIGSAWYSRIILFRLCARLLFWEETKRKDSVGSSTRRGRSLFQFG